MKIKKNIYKNYNYIPDRSDKDKYLYLKQDQSVESNQIMSKKCHKDLLRALKLNNYSYLTDVQSQAIEKGILDNNNMIITSESGSGKTLAYLLPVLNQLYKHYSVQSEEKKQRFNRAGFKMNQLNEDLMF